jgi:phosphoribosyl 1,2-cyclic phosphodiesterase
MLILDAGTGIRKLGLHLQETSGGKPLHLHLFLTHVHWDHIQGFPFFVPAFVRGNHLDIYGSRPSEKSLERVLRGQMDREYFPVSLGDLAAEICFHELRGDRIRIGPFEISQSALNHPGAATAYRIGSGGRAVVYATDTEVCREGSPSQNTEEGLKRGRRDEDLVNLATEADLYIADSQYTPEEYGPKVGWGHSCDQDAVRLALKARVKCLALFHHDPMHDDRQIDRKVARAKVMVVEAGSSMRVLAAQEGAEIEV